MFGVLLESAARTARRPGGTALSIATHAGIIAALLAAPHRATPRGVSDDALVHPTIYVDPRSAPLPRDRTDAVVCRACAPVIDAIPRPTIDFPKFTPPTLPDVGTSATSTAYDWDHASADASGPTGRGAGVPVAGEAWTADAVERAAVVVDAPPPRYPDALRAAGIDGRVVIQFVVDTSGRVEPASVRVRESTNAQFERAVREALPRLRFRPAEVGGHAVRMLAEMPFEFRVTP